VNASAARKKPQSARERREKAVAKAQAAIEEAGRDHDKRASTIEAERAAVEKRSQAEDAGWEKQKEKLDIALRRARGACSQ
jgi:colicin import membrane protein